jgi:hypothetical protein
VAAGSREAAATGVSHEAVATWIIVAAALALVFIGL